MNNKLAIFKSNDHWFYSFEHNWSVYRSNRGFDSHRDADLEARKHIAEVTTIDAQKAKAMPSYRQLHPNDFRG